MEIRKIEADDAARLEEFFGAIPADDRTFFKEDLSDAETVRAMADGSRRGARWIAVEDGAILGYVAVHPGTGLSSHVGEIRLVVAPGGRRRGLGRDLARRVLLESVRDLGLRKLFVEVVAEQEPAIQMFRRLGFVAEAILRDQLCDRSGAMHDLILLAHFVEENWSSLRGLGLDREVG